MYSEKFKTFIKIWINEFAISRSIDNKTCVDKDNRPLPWYTYPAIEYLQQFDYRNKKIFEFGCGNSSKFWSQRACQVISVEDNPEWFAKWQQEFTADNQTVLLRPEGVGYENAIFETNDLYDVIIVDGKRREKCCATAVCQLAAGGIIILDDSDRVNTSSEYRLGINTLREAGLLQIDFYGFCPTNNYTKTTSVFFSRDFDFPCLNAVQPINGIGNLWGMSRKARKDFVKKQL